MAYDYEGVSYKDIREECKAKGINAKGSRDALITRLVNAEMEVDTPDFVPVDRAGRPLHKPDATDPDPNNPNYDLAGRWRRRPVGFVEWGKDGNPVCQDDPA